MKINDFEWPEKFQGTVKGGIPVCGCLNPQNFPSFKILKNLCSVQIIVEKLVNTRFIKD